MSTPGGSRQTAGRRHTARACDGGSEEESTTRSREHAPPTRIGTARLAQPRAGRGVGRSGSSNARPASIVSPRRGRPGRSPSNRSNVSIRTSVVLERHTPGRTGREARQPGPSRPRPSRRMCRASRPRRGRERRRFRSVRRSSRHRPARPADRTCDWRGGTAMIASCRGFDERVHYFHDRSRPLSRRWVARRAVDAGRPVFAKKRRAFSSASTRKRGRPAVSRAGRSRAQSRCAASFGAPRAGVSARAIPARPTSFPSG